MISNWVSNIILIGMPGAGKSTIGILLAKAMDKAFIDTDLLIQEREGKLLQEILENLGNTRFLELENSIINNMDVINTVIATGGSIVYCPDAIAGLRRTGKFIYLDLPYDELEARIGKGNARGIVMLEQGKGLQPLYVHRKPMYEKLADITIDCFKKEVEEIVRLIIDKCKKDFS